MKTKLLFLRLTESTGLNAKKHGVIQVAIDTW